ELADFVGDDGETSAGFTSAGGFDSGIEREQVGLFRDVVDDVDDFRNLEGAVTEGLDFLRGGLHGRTNALHAFEGVAHGAVTLFGGVQCAARGFGAGFSVVGDLFHGDRKLFHGTGGVGDFLVLLGCAGLHFVGGDENVVGARGNFHGSLTNALKHLGEVVEHVVDGVGHVAQGVAGDLAAHREFAAGNLVNGGEKFRDAALQRLTGFLVAVGFRDFSDGAIQIFRDVAEVVIGLDVGARAGIAGCEAFRKFRELLYRRDNAAEAPRQDDAD